VSQLVVTVLVCTYNDELTIADSLQSVLAQTAAPSRYRVLVVDDGSTDATRWILDRYQERIEIVHMSENRGLVAACNEGLSRIETPFFLRLDTDDRLDPELLTALLECHGSTGADLVFTDRWEQLPSGRRQLCRLTNPPRIDQLIAAGTLLPTGLVRELGGYRDLFWEEFDLYMRLFHSGRCQIAHLPRPLYVYRVQRPDQMTADEQAIETGWRQLRDLWPGEALPSRYEPGRRSGESTAATRRP
jgi:glycosyltransferase involved in cell wall biosynthesis